MIPIADIIDRPARRQLDDGAAARSRQDTGLIGAMALAIVILAALLS